MNGGEVGRGEARRGEGCPRGGGGVIPLEIKRYEKLVILSCQGELQTLGDFSPKSCLT